MSHQAEAIIVTCIDFRLQKAINKWIDKNFKIGTFDRVALGGGVKNLDAILSQIDISVKLHNIKKAILVNHEDCGAYGAEGTVEKHTEDLRNAKLRVKVEKKYPDLEVDTYYLHLDGTFEPIV